MTEAVVLVSPQRFETEAEKDSPRPEEAPPKKPKPPKDKT